MIPLKTCVVLEPVSRMLNTRIPRLQRSIDEKHVDEMVQDQITEYNKHKCFSMLQSITVGVLNGDNFILDGQHRLSAFTKMQRMGFPIHEAVIPVVIYNAISKDEISDYYNRINKHMPIHPFEREAAWEDVGKAFCERFATQFSSYMKRGKACRCPHISMDELKTHLHARNINNRLTAMNRTIDDMWNAVVDINDYMKGKANDQMCPKMHKRLQECELKAAKHACNPCYLGAWRRFEWLDLALYRVDNPKAILNLAEFNKDVSVRKRIPAVIREHVWKKHNSNVCDAGECYVCKAALRFNDMECGHIVAHALGGATTIDNLMPICKTCNRDMGIMNLMEYKTMLSSMTNIMDLD